MSCFSFYLFSFFYKIREKEGRTSPAQGLIPVGGGKVLRIGG
jgi:hypothetical protein